MALDLMVTRRINGETGEVMYENVKKVKPYFNDNGYLLWRHKDYTKVFNHIDYPPELSDSHGFSFCRIVRRFLGDGNELVIRDDGVLRGVTFAELSKFLEVGERQMKRILDAFVELEMMDIVYSKKTGESTYFINPIYQIHGSRIPNVLYRRFRSSIIKHIPDKAVIEFDRRIAEEDEETEGRINE